MFRVASSYFVFSFRMKMLKFPTARPSPLLTCNCYGRSSKTVLNSHVYAFSFA